MPEKLSANKAEFKPIAPGKNSKLKQAGTSRCRIRLVLDAGAALRKIAPRRQ
jgi:hypothetical protein